MNAKFGIAVLAGAAVMFVIGWLVFGIALAGFYESNMIAPAGTMKEAPNFVFLILSVLVLALLIGVVLNWAGVADAASGFKTAAIFGLLMGLSMNLGQYSMANLSTLTITLVDPILGAVNVGIGGAVIGMMLGRGDSA